MKKYEFTGETKSIGTLILRRIRRISDGDLGGWIEQEENLSHDGNCWVAGDARIFENAQVSGNARVSGDAQVSGWAEVFGDTWVF